MLPIRSNHSITVTGQILNAVSQHNALLLRVPYRYCEYCITRFWVDYSIHIKKERLMEQIPYKHADPSKTDGYAKEKPIQTADIIILQIGEDDLIKPIYFNFRDWKEIDVLAFAQYYIFNENQKERISAYLKSKDPNINIQWQISPSAVLNFEPGKRTNGIFNQKQKAESAKSKKLRKAIWLLMYRQQVFPSETPEGYRARFEAWDANCPVRKHEYEFKEYNRFKTEVEIKEKVYDAIFDEVRLQELGVDMDKYRAIVGSV